VSDTSVVEGVSSPRDGGWRSLAVGAFAVVMCAQAASGLVQGAAPMAMPAISEDLGASSSALQWYASLFPLGFALVLILAGRVGDLFGTRRLLLLGYGGLTATFVLSAVAPNIQVLLAARLLQGVAAGVMAPQLSAMIQRMFTGHDRTRAFAVFLVSTAGSFMTGQLVTGALITSDVFGVGWRWAYLPCTPFALLTFLVARRVLPQTPPGTAGRLDLGGAAALGVTALLLMFPVIQGRNAGWPVWLIAMLVAAIPAFVGFLSYERRVIERGGDPLVDPVLFRIPTFRIGNLLTIVISLITYAVPIYMILVIQSGFGRSALEAALLTAPMPFANMFGSLLAATLVRRIGRAAVAVGGVLTGASSALVLVATSGGAGSVEATHLLPGIVLLGFASGISIASAMAIVLHDVPARYAGAAAGVQSTSLQLAGAVGVAFFGMVFYGAVAETTDEAAYLDAITNVQWIAVGLAVLQSVLVVLLPRQHVAAGEEIIPVEPEMLVVPDLHADP
jgi:MFS family permease